MKYVVRTLVLCLIAFTALAMADSNVAGFVVAWIGPFALYIFDLLLVAGVATFFYVVSLRLRTDPTGANRVVLRLTGAYLLYQLVVVVPLAVIVHDVGPGDAYANMNGRFALALIPFFYYVALRYVRPQHLIVAVNVAAVGLLLYGLYRYVAVGPQGIWEYGQYRLRLLWGGSTLLFGWLAITGLLLQRKALYAYGMGLAGVLGVVLVNHRSGYVATILAFLVYVVMSRRITPRAVAVAVVVVIGGLLLTAASPTIRENATYSLTTMFNASADMSAQDRVERTALAWDYVKANPLGDYVWSRAYYLVDLGDAAFEPHNFVIQVLDKQGWISAGLLFATIGSILAVGWSVRRSSKIGVAMTVYLVFYLVFCLFNTNFDSIVNVTLFTLAAALILYENARRHEQALESADETAGGTTEGAAAEAEGSASAVSTPRAS